jgi:hypothetical protein
VAADDAAAVGRAARDLIARIPSRRRTRLGERTGAPFGYKTGWIAARTDDPEAVARALGLADLREVSWEEGIEASYRGSVFVSPPTQGWVLAVGVELLDRAPDLVALSAQLDTEVQLFGTHRVVEAHRWERATDGVLRRRLRYVGERDEAEAIGEPTDVERERGFDWVLEQPAAPPQDEAVPDEEDVMLVAAQWSLDPRELANTATSSEIGLSGRLTRDQRLDDPG